MNLMNNLFDAAKQYPSLDLGSLLILLTIYENPGFCIRELADILTMDQKAVQEKVAMLANGRKNKKWTRLKLVTVEYKVGDRRKRDLMLTAAGRDLAEKLTSVE